VYSIFAFRAIYKEYHALGREQQIVAVNEMGEKKGEDKSHLSLTFANKINPVW